MNSASPNQDDAQSRDYGFHPACTDATGILETHAVKIKAKELGADLVGICELNRDLLTENAGIRDHEGSVAFSHVVTIGIVMNAEAFRTSPSQELRDETYEGYRRMKETACALGEYIAELGYNAYSAGNSNAPSVALAVESGLGTLGRNGMLLAPSHGPCLRICKVFTDMPLEIDQRIGMGMEPRCEACDLCAKACPGNAIEGGQQPADGRWRVDRRACSTHWGKVEKTCAACISVCPLTWAVLDR